MLRIPELTADSIIARVMVLVFNENSVSAGLTGIRPVFRREVQGLRTASARQLPP
jgi:hypothetical protein